MRYLVLFILFALLLFKCSHKEETAIIDVGTFSIKAPKAWRALEVRGTDSKVGSIALDTKDTLHFDLGFYSNRLYEFDPPVVDSGFLRNFDSTKQDISYWIVVKDRMSVDLDDFKYNNVRWDTIDGRRAKIVFPRTSGKGITGVYIDSLWMSDNRLVHFNLYGRDLQQANEEKVLKALLTLKFTQEK